MSRYRISELVDRTQIPASTLRFYEDAGLLTAERTPAGYRIYDDTAVDRLEFIASAKAMGMSLDDIGDLLQVWDTGVCTSVRAQLAPLINQRLAETEQRIAELSAFSVRLQAVRSGLAGPAPQGACGPGCGCLVTDELVTDEPASSAPPGVRDLGLSPAIEKVADVPAIACSLGNSDEIDERLRRWHDLLASATERRQPDPNDETTLRVAYVFASRAALPALSELVAAEQECCSFYTFSMHLTGEGITLEVRAPSEAQPLVDELFGVST